MPPMDESTPVSMQVERIVPQISAAIRTGYTSIGSEIRAFKAEMLQNMDQYREESRRESRQQMTDFFQQGLNYCGQLDGVTASGSNNQETNVGLRSSPAINDSIYGEENLAPIRQAPVYRLDRTLKTVVDVWTEYIVGIKGGPSVEKLEFEFGTEWRKERTEARYFSRRNVFYKEIKRMAAELSISEEEAARNIERTRQRMKKTLDGLREIISGTYR